MYLTFSKLARSWKVSEALLTHWLHLGLLPRPIVWKPRGLPKKLFWDQDETDLIDFSGFPKLPKKPKKVKELPKKCEDPQVDPVMWRPKPFALEDSFILAYDIYLDYLHSTRWYVQSSTRAKPTLSELDRNLR